MTSNNFEVSSEERKRYVLKENRDYGILFKCKLLEKQKLSSTDRLLIKFIRTQLEDDWREPILRLLKKLLKKYKPT